MVGLNRLMLDASVPNLSIYNPILTSLERCKSLKQRSCFIVISSKLNFVKGLTLFQYKTILSSLSHLSHFVTSF